MSPGPSSAIVETMKKRWVQAVIAGYLCVVSVFVAVQRRDGAEAVPATTCASTDAPNDAPAPST